VVDDVREARPPPAARGRRCAPRPLHRRARRSRLPVAVVTGGSSGIGEAIARRLGEHGWLCVLVARREELLRPLAEELNGEYEVCDVADREAVERMAANVRERHPAISLLVNNAGIAGRASFLDVDPERIERITSVNYLGGVWCTRAFLPALEAGRPSHIVNVVSVAGTVSVGAGPYAASKHAQLAFSRALGAQLRPRGIAVHTINPGFVETPGFPQRGVLRSGLLERAVVDPPVVADAVMRAIDRDQAEVFVPRWYRAAAIAQALLPGVLSRAGRRR
jgi:NAD(P)-dependent dehydrogenase (short-subunit alcohol dehydrogenase family)